MTFRRLFNFLTFNIFSRKDAQAVEEEYFLKNNKEKKIPVSLIFQCEKKMFIYARDEEEAHRLAYKKLMDSVDTFSDSEFLSSLPVEVNSKNLHSIKNF